MKAQVKSTYWLLAVIIIAVVAPCQRVYSQVSTCDKVQKVGANSFNYPETGKPHSKYRNENSIKVVFSDRDDNIAYADPYAQQQKEKQKMGTAYFVIDSKNDAFELVSADFNALGKPKTFFSFLMSAKYHFKDARSAPYIGWIPKKNLLHFNHSFLHTDNNRPLKYHIGIKKISRLFDMNHYFSGDTLRVYKDPFLKEKTKKHLLLNQIVYPYKYDETGKAVLVSDKATLTDTTTQVLGWIPSDLISLTGQNQVSRIGENAHIPVVKTSGDTIHLEATDLHSDLVYHQNGNAKTFSDLDDNNAIIPLSVWDRSKNKLINIKGRDLMVSEIYRMEKESKRVKLHLLFFENDKRDVSVLLNALQNIWLHIADSKHFQYTFSATCIAQGGNYRLPATPAFAVWLDYISRVLSSDKTLKPSTSAGLEQAIGETLKETGTASLENNLFILLGTEQDLKLNTALVQQIAQKSGKFLFVQIKNLSSAASQDFLLQAKELLYEVALQYSNYIGNYIVENSLVKDPAFINLTTAEQDNIYVFDAPAKSLVNGGIVFPQTGNTLSNVSLNTALDSLISKSQKTNELLLHSLQKHEQKLGTLRSQPSPILTTLFKDTELSDSLQITQIDRNSINETFYKKASFRDSLMHEQACLLNQEELKQLLLDYHSLLPDFSGKITKKELQVLKKMYKEQVKLINRQHKRKVLDNCSSLTDLFYYKTGMPVFDNHFSQITISRLTRKKTLDGGFDTFYTELINKLHILEEMFLKDRLETLRAPQTGYYYIPKHLLL